jgi:hypothetical protein
MGNHKTNDNKKRFIDFLKEEGFGNVTFTCKKLGLDRSNVYKWKKEDEGFSEEWDKAVPSGMEKMADEAELALMSQLYKNVTACIFTLKNLRAEKWNDRYEVGATVHNILEIPDDVKKAIKQGFREALKRGGSEDTPSTGS